MAATALATQEQGRGQLAVEIERVLVAGDLGRLTPEQRLEYYSRLCSSLGLNPLTRPFEYLVLKGKTVLYARKDATEQLRKLHGVSVERPEVIYSDDLVIVSVTARDASGRSDSDIGAVPVKGLQGEDRANAVMKALTKAKRRVTLSICGLGMLDETEVESIPGAGRVVEEQGGRMRTLPAAPSGELAADDAEMAVLRTELGQWFERYPDAKKTMDDFLRSKGARGLSDDAVRKAVEALRKRAAKEEAEQQQAAGEPGVTDNMTPEQHRAASVESGRRLLRDVAGRPQERPNKGDILAGRAILRELDTVDPRDDDNPAAGLDDKEIIGELSRRALAANARQHSQAAAPAAEAAPADDVPF